MNKFNTIYVTGCSFSEGGGLYDIPTKKLYKELYDVSWDDFHKVTYGYRVAEHFDCELVMDAKCGGGLERVIRKFWDFVKDKSDEELNKVIFFIEAPGAQQRLDFYSSKDRKHFVVNLNMGYDLKLDWPEYFKQHRPIEESLDIENFGITFDYAIKERINDNDESLVECKESVLGYVQDLFDPIKYESKIRGSFIFMLSYMLRKKLKFFVIPTGVEAKFIYKHLGEDILNNFIDLHMKNDINKLRKDVQSNIPVLDFLYWCEANKFTIQDEIKKADGHPGYFGHKEFSKIIIKNIERDL
jgi:hypothetical protein